MKNALTIRPLNPDNDIEIQHVVALFERASARAALSPAVLSSRHWKCSAGRRFSALIALHEGRIIAHCGFAMDKRSSGVATITHAMVDPEAGDLVPAIAAGYKELILAQMARKDLHTLLVIRHQDAEFLQPLFSGMGLSPVAEFPDQNRTVELWALLLHPVTTSGRTVVESRSLEHIPMSLRGSVTATLRSLGLKVITRAEVSGDFSAMPADEIAVEPFPASRSARAVLFATPSLLFAGDSRTTFKQRLPRSLDRALNRWPHASIAVKINDPRCEDMVKLLEVRGFTYSGFLPSIRGRDSLLFVPTPNEAFWHRNSPDLVSERI